MKITDLKVFVVDQFVYVKIETDEGIYGIGEASLSGRSSGCRWSVGTSSQTASDGARCDPN